MSAAGAFGDPRIPQLRAADPSGSAWVSANAGSGKTRVLVERVARMLLAGAHPHRILCLTYTNAAAAEMQNRLFAMLGEWAMLDDAALSSALNDLAEGEAAATPEDLARARRLFAQALETPGGLKVQTIHAFCATVLRRFPMEAGVSPRFEVLDDRSRGELLAQAREAAITAATRGDDPTLAAAFDTLTARLAEDSLEGLLDEAMSRSSWFVGDDAIPALYAALGVPQGADCRREVLAWRDALDVAALTRAVEILTAGKSSDAQHGDRLARLCAGADGGEIFTAGCAVFLTGNGAARKLEKTPTKDVDAGHLWIRPLLLETQKSFLDLLDQVRACQCAEISNALHVFGKSVLHEFTNLKARHGALDFDDIIQRTLALLEQAETASWVLYKLDGGLDHILVDEAQDTSPDQWRAIATLLEEFHAGLGAETKVRTLFVVGDEKQSIYSFQGADPREFEVMRRRLAHRLEEMGRGLTSPNLMTSFRSASAILQVVDGVLADPAAAGMSVGKLVNHAAERDSATDPGRVDLWPVVPPEERAEEPPWWTPVDAPGPADPELRLADAIAQEVARWLSTGVAIPGKGRSVTPGDILILVRRRGKLAKEILRRLQQLSVPVAGADRLRIADHIAIRDLMALAKVALLPEDDLSLAALLRSPLCGLSEDDLFDLAHGRRQSRLWDRLTAAKDQHADAVEMLRDMSAQADYLRPFEFLQRMLIRHDGRRRLIGRLGPDSDDAIDELLSQALAYEQAETPSLQGFVEWIETGDPEIKREQQPREEGDPGVVRLMTVHGAKGLESPIVILPDTLAPARARDPQILALKGLDRAVAASAGAAKDDPPALSAAREDARQRAEEERTRLLYVAMTRAEDWLVVCAAGDAKRAEEGWHGLVRRAMAESAQPLETPLSALGLAPGLRVEDATAAQIEAQAESEHSSPSRTPQAPQALPDWLSRPLPVEKATERPLSPSDLGGAHTVPAEQVGDGSPDAPEHDRGARHAPGRSDPSRARIRRRCPPRGA